MTTPERPVLIIKHIDIEGPGTLGEFIERNGIRHQVVNAFLEDSYIEEPGDYSAVITLGGPMGVYDDTEVYPFLAWEDAFLSRAIREDVPVLGICLGAQLIAKAAGARVTKAPEKEIGWSGVTLTDEGRADPLFKGLSPEILVFQWHGDTFDIPEGGRRLAASDVCPNQAFRVGRAAYGLQFHLEVTPPMINQWIDAYEGELNSLRGIVDAREIARQSEENATACSAHAERFYTNFFNISGVLA
ncbi:MAG: gamma-glutamyl-gamma-aminobutyrate hydrolase family protein [Candidatus Brocadiales bacterium]